MLINETEGLGRDLATLLKDRVRVDIRFHLGMESLERYGHSLIVCTRSPYLAEKLAQALQVGSVTTIRLPNLRVRTFELALQYMYTGSVDIANDTVQELTKTAIELRLEGLAKRCAEYMIDNISHNNIFQLTQLAEEEYGEPEQASSSSSSTSSSSSSKYLCELRDECHNYFIRHFDELKSRREILAFNHPQTIRSLLSLDRLYVDELDVWKVAVQWAYRAARVNWTAQTRNLFDFPTEPGSIVVRTPMLDTFQAGGYMTSSVKVTREDEVVVEEAEERQEDKTIATIATGLLTPTTSPRPSTSGRGEFSTEPSLLWGDAMFAPQEKDVVVVMRKKEQESLKQKLNLLVDAVRFTRIPAEAFVRLVARTGLLRDGLCEQSNPSKRVKRLRLLYRCSRNGFETQETRPQYV
ncbi:hypothetical protein DFQ27_000117 [Actinomortierella ambigua]|uniref:BTB domain-containing protein n=1 Tax=Actinomortierella ambigua TaxID=1343610 RepID=A0A9P6UA65_9FUNG|nr:hypothetical protein DFQ27_000117 [Actinomortierella ambigua]